jgi:hypothetical protein
MSSPSLPAAVAEDFASVLALLQSRQIIPEKPTTNLVNNARRIHSITYGLILWRFRLRNLPEHSKVFLEEIASDALQILPQIMMGYGKTAKLLVRGVLENALRHLYFSDHPIEYQRMNRDKKWFQTIDSLCDYAKSHPVLWKIEPKFDAINQIGSIYSELSAGVHGRSVHDLEMRAALQRIAYDEESAARETDLLARGAAAVNFSLAVFHREKVRAMQIDDRRIILRSMPPRARQLWAEHE